MFDDNNISDYEIQMRSILADAQEDIPAHVWDNVSAGLDKIEAAERKPAVLWFRRTAIAVAAAAAVAVGFIADWNVPENIIPESGSPDMIAVVAGPEILQESVEAVPAAQETAVYIADAGRVRKPAGVSEMEDSCPAIESGNDSGPEVTTEEAQTQLYVHSSEDAAETVQKEQGKEIPTTAAIALSEADEWEEDEEVRKKRKASIVLSGVASTNSVQNNNGRGATRLPSISTINPVTGVKQTKDESSYGLPLSVGVGVKFRFSPRWSIGAGASYTMLSRRFKGTYTNVGSDGKITVVPESDIRNTQHYIGIPVNVYYDIVSKEHLNFYTYLGGTVEKCISDRYDVLGSNIIHREKVDGMQYSATVGLGVEFLIGKHLGVYIDPSLRYYFSNSQPKSIRTVQPLMMGLEMGLRINL